MKSLNFVYEGFTKYLTMTKWQSKIFELQLCLTFKHRPHKMVKHTQKICRQIASKLFECVLPFCGVGA